MKKFIAALTLLLAFTINANAQEKKELTSAEKAKKENWNLVAMLNNDMIGNSNSSETNINDNTRVRIFSEGVPAAETEQMAAIRRYTNGENDSKSRQLARYMKEVGERYVDQLEVKLVYRNDRFLRGGDHTPFAREGFTAIRVCEMNENYYHQHENVRIENGIQYGDLPEFMDFEYMRKVTGINLASLYSMASAPSGSVLKSRWTASARCPFASTSRQVSSAPFSAAGSTARPRCSAAWRRGNWCSPTLRSPT